AVACPDPPALQRLALGQLPGPEAETLGQHILGCPACAQRLEALQAADPLLTDLRALPLLAPPPGADALVERLVGLSPPNVVAATPGTSAADTPGLPGEAEPLPDRLGRYQVIGRLGADGMGVVWRAHDPQLGRGPRPFALRSAL